MPLLRSFTVENFRSIREPVTLGLQPGITVLHGKNSVGKSNLLSALEMAWEILREPGVVNQLVGQDVEVLIPESAVLQPHDDRPADPISFRLELTAVTVVLTLQPQSGSWGVTGRLEGDDVTAEALRQRMTGPYVTYHPDRLTAALELSAPPVSRIENDKPPGDVRSWDAWLLNERDLDPSGRSGGQRFTRVAEALRHFAPELGAGSLDRIKKRRTDMSVFEELAWQANNGVRRSFQELGSGLRAVKNILIQLVANDSLLTIIEEPEVHLSFDAQVRLRQALHLWAASADRQIVMSSHVYAFDGPEVLRVTREAGATRVAAAHGGDTDAGLEEQALARGAQSARRGRGYTSGDGVLVLPSLVKDNIELPDYMLFVPAPNGQYTMIPSKRRPAEHDDD